MYTRRFIFHRPQESEIQEFCTHRCHRTALRTFVVIPSFVRMEKKSSSITFLGCGKVKSVQTNRHLTDAFMLLTLLKFEWFTIQRRQSSPVMTGCIHTTRFANTVSVRVYRLVPLKPVTASQRHGWSQKRARGRDFQTLITGIPRDAVTKPKGSRTQIVMKPKSIPFFCESILGVFKR